MTLFSHHEENLLKQEAPLAARMRPQSLAEFVGQEHLVGEGVPLVLINSLHGD